MKGCTESISVLVGFAAANEDLVPLSEAQLNQCVGKNGVFLPVAGSCNQFIICVEGTAVRSTCGKNHFDARRSVCDLPAYAGCISFGPEPLKSIEPICVGQVNGVKIPVSGSTSKYYLCMKEKAFLEDCGALRFDEKKMLCVARNEEPVLKPMLAPCSGIANGVKLPNPENPRQYFFCMNEKAFLKDCGSLYFDTTYSACSLFPEVELPKVETSSVIQPSKQLKISIPIPKQPAQQSNAVDQEICKNQRFGARVAAPGSCSDYYVCMGSSVVRKSCKQLQFNPIYSSCDEPSNVHCFVEPTGVVYGSKETAKLLPQESSQSQELSICSGQRDGIFVAAPGKCSEFYFCFMDRAFSHSCGALHFSPITQSCVEVEKSNCIESSRVVAPTKIIEANSCLSRENGALLKHPTDCGKFLICDNHMTVAMDCPAGLHFNSERNYCDWPELAKCF